MQVLLWAEELTTGTWAGFSSQKFIGPIQVSSSFISTNLQARAIFLFGRCILWTSGLDISDPTAKRLFFRRADNPQAQTCACFWDIALATFVIHNRGVHAHNSSSRVSGLRVKTAEDSVSFRTVAAVIVRVECSCFPVLRFFSRESGRTTPSSVNRARSSFSV